jgi:plastocyanin
LDQKDCQYEPRVIALRVGQKLDILNSDATFHNVKTNSKSNENFNLAMPSKNDRITKVFSQPELFIESECSVHPWMSASIAVMDHPFFSVTDETGEFTLRNLPPGTYSIEAWHEVLGTQRATVTVTGTETQEIDFTFKR